MAPSISVIICLYNKRPYIARAVESVLGQSLRDFELVVVDDGSTDGSASELERFRKDPRLRIVRQSNAGEGAARNRGLREMTSDLAAFLDADDAFLPHHLESMIALAGRYPDAGLLGAAYYQVLPDGSRVARTLGGEDGWILDDYFAASRRSGFVLLNSSSACVRRSAVESAGGFLEGVPIGADLEFWARIALRSPVAYTARPGSLYYLWTPASAMAAYRWRPDFPVVVEMIHRELEARTAKSNSLSSAADYASWILLKHAACGIVSGQRHDAMQLLRHPVFAKSRLRRHRALVWAAAACAPDAALRAYLALRNRHFKNSRIAPGSPSATGPDSPVPALHQQFR